MSDPLFTFRQTPAAGHSAFSLCAIPKDTMILTLPGPYASVVMRKWRKEVCAWCFKWRYAPVLAASSTLACPSSATPKGTEGHQHGRKNRQNSHFLAGLWHCSPSCLTSWIRDFELWDGEDAQWVANILEAFEKTLGEMTRREREYRLVKSLSTDGDCVIKEAVCQANESNEKGRSIVLDSLSKDMADVDMSAAQITPEFLDCVWTEVGDLSSGFKTSVRATVEGKISHVSLSKSTIPSASSSSISASVSSSSLSHADSYPTSLPYLDLDKDTSSARGRESQKGQKSRTKQSVAMPRLNELELDTTRFVLDGMVRKVVDQFRMFSKVQASDFDGNSQEAAPDSAVPLRLAPRLAMDIMSNAGLWKDFLLLQNNELEYIRSKPYMLAAGIKIYVFLKGMVSDLFGERRRRNPEPSCQQDAEGAQERRRALEMLLSDLENFEVVRAILCRDPGNVFGIWEEEDEEESEMYGWGTYVFGSFFNHDCTPNIKKRRSGRSVEFYTMKDVREGEELSIAYVDVEEGDEEREKRNIRLTEEWFFSCQCQRCVTA